MVSPRSLVWLVLALSSVAQAASPDPIEQAEDLRQVGASALSTGATSTNASVRARVARAYGRIQQADGIAPLERLLKDSSPTVRSEAAFALGQFGWKVPFAAGREAEITTALKPVLSDASLAVRLAAIEAVGKIGVVPTMDPLLPTFAPDLLSPLLADSNPEIRAETLMALYRYCLVIGLRTGKNADLPAVLIPRVLALSHDSHAEVRRNVAFIFAKFKTAGVTDTMITLSSDPALWVRFFAVTALQTGADVKGAPAAVKAFSDPAYEVRVAAVNAAAGLKSLAQIDPTVAAADSMWEVRAAYAGAVGTSGVPLSTLDPFRKDPSPSVRAAVLDSLVAGQKADHPKDADAELQAAAKDPNFLIRKEAADDAVGIDEQLALDLWANDSDVRVRSDAIQTVSSFTDAAAFAALSKAVFSPLIAESSPAAGALEGRADPGMPALAWQGYQAKTGEAWAGVRTEFLAPLVDLKNAQTTGWLTQALGDPDHTVVDMAYAELKARQVPGLGPETVRPFSETPYAALRFHRDPAVILETNKGTVEIHCFAKAAPIHVANFVGRARDGLYNGIAWHRVVPDFVVQGASTDGTGWGDPGYQLRAEINRKRFIRGAIGMPRSDDFNSGNDEIFITNVPTPHLDGQYTIFGQVSRGMNVVDQIEVGDVITRAYVRY